MRMIVLSLLLCLFDLSFGQNTPPTYYIPAGGQTINNLSYYAVSGQDFFVTTSGAVNLGSNTYTLTYASLPPANTQWSVIFDASNLTLATNTNVNIFGETPLATYTPIKKFYINFMVVWQGGVPTKKVNYFSSLDDLKTFVSTITFNGRVNFNDSVFLYGLKTYLKPVSAITTGQTVIVTDTSGKLGFGCEPWCVTGNSGLSPSANFLGTTDTGSLRFRVNNVASGFINYNSQSVALGYQSNISNTSGIGNASFGYQSLYANTTGTGNTAIGGLSLPANTTGQLNTSIGGGSMLFNTTGSNNVVVGYSSLPANTTGHDNTAIGYNTLTTNTVGNYNIAIGSSVNPASASTTKGIGIGYQATASSNQLAIAGIRSISIPQMTSALNYILTDTSGLGDFVPRVNPVFGQTTYTPVTGDSLTITTSQNDINPAGTLAVLTIILPANPVSGFIYEFSTTQVLTSLLWSVALSGGSTTGLPSALAQYGTIKIKWSSTLSRWLNY